MGCSGSSDGVKNSKPRIQLKPGELPPKPITDFNRPPDTEAIIECIRNTQGFKFPQVDKNYVLKVHSSRDEDVKFIKSVSGLKFPNFKTLCIYKGEMLDSTCLNEFFTYCTPNSLQTLYFEFDGNIKHLALSLGNMLMSITNEVFFSQMKIDQKSLRAIFENCYGLRKIVFHYCEFLELDELFIIDYTRKYLLSELNFFGSFERNHKDFRHIVKAFSLTKLKRSTLKFVLSKQDFVDNPWSILEKSILPIKTCLDVGFVRDKSYWSWTKYEGGFSDEKPFGFGKKISSGSVESEGIYYNGVKQGFHVRYLSDGSVEMGYYDNDSKDGMHLCLRSPPPCNYINYAILYNYGSLRYEFRKEELADINQMIGYWNNNIGRYNAMPIFEDNGNFNYPAEFTIIILTLNCFQQSKI